MNASASHSNPSRRNDFLRTRSALVLATLALSTTTAWARQGPPPPPPIPALGQPNTPPANPITEPKRVLGKILFFDEQLSMDNTVSCATCHTMSRAGADPRRVMSTTGTDGIAGTGDDKFGSPGVIHNDAFQNYVRDAVFGTQRQVTGRSAMPVINAAFFTSNFWDGRATPTFTNPETGLVSLQANAGLESQVVGPPVNSVEMGHDNINWSEVTGKLRRVKPLALATNLPTDVATVLASNPNYAQLFQAAFGDTNITADRIARAVATYERTLVSDQTPWDRFNAGDTTALTVAQQRGLGTFVGGGRCNVCHGGALFADNTFRNIGLRLSTEDLGRQIVTDNPNDRGRMKVPTLRNVGLRTNFMHTAEFTTLEQVVAFYGRLPGGKPQVNDNRDPVIPTINIAPGGQANDLVDFLRNGLTDQRVANQTFPFDRPTLYSERTTDQPANLGGGVPGSGNLIPVMIASDPPMLGNREFRLGLSGALPGASARLIVSKVAPTAGVIAADRSFDTLTVGADGVATQPWALIAPWLSSGDVLYTQWVIDDPSAAGGQARSNVVSVRLFCGSSGCPIFCSADYNRNGTADTADIFAFLSNWFAGCTNQLGAPCSGFSADIDRNGSLEVPDIFAFLSTWFAGC